MKLTQEIKVEICSLADEYDLSSGQLERWLYKRRGISITRQRVWQVLDAHAYQQYIGSNP